MHEDSLRSGLDPPTQQLPPQVHPHPFILRYTLSNLLACCCLCDVHTLLLQKHQACMHSSYVQLLECFDAHHDDLPTVAH